MKNFVYGREIAAVGIASIAAACAVASVACSGSNPTAPEASETEVAQESAAATLDPFKSTSLQLTAVDSYWYIDTNPMRIAVSGHGTVLDAKGQEIKLDAYLIGAMQKTMKADLQKALGEYMSYDAQKLWKEVDVVLADQYVPADQKLYLNGAFVWRLLQEKYTPKQMKIDYEWRNELLNRNVLPAKFAQYPFKLVPAVQRIIDWMRYHDWDFRFPDRQYIQRCRDASVPIPPDWAETGTAWQNQGALSHNILRGRTAPGEYAGVYTYTDPSVRGACVALPRGSGAPGTLAGIICQSATTGAACFWDNTLREATAPMGWRGVTLPIARLKDGTNLMADNCTSCHRGNNVFLISPDDTTWGTVLRSLPTIGTRTFTTRVEGSSDTAHGYPRYVPITTMFGRETWQNFHNPATGYCAGCHEQPADSVLGLNIPSMPPACASTPLGCYR
jgi:hypothetical protein